MGKLQLKKIEIVQLCTATLLLVKMHKSLDFSVSWKVRDG